ncbi:hypothetical protein [Acinetobacter brisouii]|uniref:hypothetical protein n=1 Tax=Acinetobacter brisouii TaxID=396323 RepID=UPI00124F8940|nr:hypothetical protein [Acinetobacter brisouii]
MTAGFIARNADDATVVQIDSDGANLNLCFIRKTYIQARYRTQYTTQSPTRIIAVLPDNPALRVKSEIAHNIAVDANRSYFISLFNSTGSDVSGGCWVYEFDVYKYITASSTFGLQIYNDNTELVYDALTPSMRVVGFIVGNMSNFTRLHVGPENYNSRLSISAQNRSIAIATFGSSCDAFTMGSSADMRIVEASAYIDYTASTLNLVYQGRYVGTTHEGETAIHYEKACSATVMAVDVTNF